MESNIREKLINLFRKVITSLTCISKLTKNEEIQKQTDFYIMKFIKDYEIYKNSKDSFKIKLDFDGMELIDFCNECYSLVEIVDFAEDVEYGFKEIVELINKERGYKNE